MLKWNAFHVYDEYNDYDMILTKLKSLNRDNIKLNEKKLINKIKRIV
jgi:hypothetical protein